MSMEQNENREELENGRQEVQSIPADGADTLSEEEKREILSVFSETNENKRRRTGFKLTIRNQLILVGSVLALAGILLGVYFLFLKEEEPHPDFYAIDAQTVTVLNELNENVTLTFCNREKGDLTEEADPDVYRIYTYATLYEAASGDVKIRFDESDTYNGVKISCGGKTLEYGYADFYVSRKSDGAVYGFTGETLLTDAILSLTGKETLELPVRPLDGYDEDGNEVLTSGGVVMFPMVDRSDISLLEVSNEHGEYVVYQGSSDTFYFEGCEALTYNAELFASLLVDCRYVVTAGKLEDRLDYSVYGLDSVENLTCHYMLLTMPDSDGEFDFHQVWVGKKAASGSYYYAMYFGGRMNADNEIIETYSSSRIFLLPYSSVEGNLTQPVETFFDAQLVNSISDVNDVYEIDRIEIDYYDYYGDGEDLSATVLNLPVIDFSDNTTSNNSSAAELLKDKKTFASVGNAYTDWTGETDSAALVGLASTDGGAFSLCAAVTNAASDGVYTCTFGLLRDSDNETYAALMPKSLSVRYSTDGINYKKFSAHGLDFSSQKEDTVKEYSFNIQSDKPVVKIELCFTMPDEIGYLVMDEVRIYADGEDAVPNDALTGIWRLLSPSEYLPVGKNYAYLDSTNFSDFLNGFASLVGDSVAEVGISEYGKGEADDIINTELLAAYGLDSPAMHFSYVFDGVTTDLYVSEYDEENACYYAYSTLTGDVYGTGKTVTACTGIVARISLETAPWLEWDLMEYVDHTLVGMYVYEIQQMTVSYNGTDYVFDVKAEDTKLTSVRYGDTEMDEESFRFLYLSIVQLYMRDEYTPVEGEEPTEYLRINIKTTSDSKEYVFYRISSSRAYYTVNGGGGYYCRISALRNVTAKLEQFIAGEKVGK